MALCQFIPFTLGFAVYSAELAVGRGQRTEFRRLPGEPCSRNGLGWVMNGRVAASSGVFISYRRTDNDYPTGWLFDRLVER